jgi:hypothetical protein
MCIHFVSPRPFCIKAGESDNKSLIRSVMMLVRFLSSETGELLMFADVAGDLLRIVGKSTTARGGFVQDEMQAAAQLLREAVQRGQQPPGPEDEDESISFLDKPVALSQRAWPFIDMLERSSKGGSKANIVWQAAADF